MLSPLDNAQVALRDDLRRDRRSPILPSLQEIITAMPDQTPNHFDAFSTLDPKRTPSQAGFSRRDVIRAALAGAAAITAAPVVAQVRIHAGDVLRMQVRRTDRSLPLNEPTGRSYRPHFRVGIGGTQSGNCFAPSTDEEVETKYEADWAAGVRYFDTSPYYGNGLSERRLGHFLHNKNRDNYVLSTKIGRIFTATTKPLPEDPFFKDPAPFTFRFDYSAAGVRRSVEDSLNRLGVSRLDIVFIHDISPDNKDLPRPWQEVFDEAAKGCMPELAKMKAEGMIGGWGFGINRPDAAIRAAERDVPTPDLCLLACQYSLADHDDALHRTFPALARKDIVVVVGTPLNAGFLGGRERFNFEPAIPPLMIEKRRRLAAACQRHGVDLRTAALQFAAAPPIVTAIVPGSHSAAQAEANIASMKVAIPLALWDDLRRDRLIAQNAPTPT